MLHLVLFGLEPREEFLHAVFLLLLLLMMVVMLLLLLLVSQATPDDAGAPSSASPELLGDLLEGLVVDASSQLAGGQLRSYLLPKLHAGGRLQAKPARSSLSCLCAGCGRTKTLFLGKARRGQGSSSSTRCAWGTALRAATAAVLL